MIPCCAMLGRMADQRPKRKEIGQVALLVNDGGTGSARVRSRDKWLLGLTIVMV